MRFAHHPGHEQEPVGATRTGRTSMPVSHRQPVGLDRLLAAGNRAVTQVLRAAPAAAPAPAPVAAPAPAAVLSAQELTERIARCIGIWETNRGQDNPAPRESKLDTAAGTRASMATIEQATMPYAISALKRNKALRESAAPPLTMAELNAAEARVIAVVTLLNAVATAGASGQEPAEFIAAQVETIEATGLSADDVETMFTAAALRGTLDAARADMAAAGEAARATAAAEHKTKKQQKAAAEQAQKDSLEASIEAIPAEDRAGLGKSSLRTYIKKPTTWGENRAGWQRKAVEAMPGEVGARIKAVSESEGGTALAIPVVRSRVDAHRAAHPTASDEDVVKAVAAKNNPGEKAYGQHVLETYQRLYP
jgi:hypothetical protein